MGGYDAFGGANVHVHPLRPRGASGYNDLFITNLGEGLVPQSHRIVVAVLTFDVPLVHPTDALAQSRRATRPQPNAAHITCTRVGFCCSGVHNVSRSHGASERSRDALMLLQCLCSSNQNGFSRNRLSIAEGCGRGGGGRAPKKWGGAPLFIVGTQEQGAQVLWFPRPAMVGHCTLV